jgi:uncharacterized membrane protein YdbT with pleckstrin-like domain
MSYVQRIIQPGEQIIRIGHRHWIIYRKAIFVAVLAIAAFIFGHHNYNYRDFAMVGGGILSAIALLFFIGAWFRQAITEIAVTNKRVIYKVGFINRHTVEMNIDKVETVIVDQSIPGRLLNYGTIHIKGTGQGIENLREIAAPIELRNAIEAR